MNILLDERKAIYLNLFSILLYGLGFFFNFVHDSELFSIIRLVAVISWFVSLLSFKYNRPKINLKLFLFVFVAIEFWVLLRANQFDKEFFRRTIATLDFSLPHFIPILLLVKLRLLHIRHIFKVLHFSNIVYLILFVCLLPLYIDRSNFDYMEYLNKLFGYANGLILLTYTFQQRKVKFLSLVIFAICFLLAVYQARRNQIFTLSLVAFFSYILTLEFNSKSIVKNVSLGIVLLSFLTVFYSDFDLKSNAFTSHIYERSTQDTRSDVLDDYWLSLGEKGIIYGKGVSSSYYSSSMYYVDTDKSGNRTGIEAGYLDIILDGGMIMLFGLILISVIAIFRGFLFSQNRFFWGLSFFLLIYLFELYPAGNPLYALRYALVFIVINICFNKKLLRMNSLILKRLLLWK